MQIIHRPSPNFNSRDGGVVDMLVLHYTGMQSGAAAIDRLCDPTAKVSAHYVIEEDGTIWQLVDEANRAWHAGIGAWRGRGNVNRHSIGIELVNPGHEHGYRAFPPAQIQALIPLCQAILARHPIPARNVVGHSDIAPDRKEDPGELFDWQQLAQAGIGLWPAKSPVASGQWSAKTVQTMLAEYGYPVLINGEWDTQTQMVITAFQRHFSPQILDGVWTDDLQAILQSLLQRGL